jgi:hypothetical protein
MQRRFARVLRHPHHRGPALRFFRNLFFSGIGFAVTGCSTLHVPAARPQLAPRESVETAAGDVVLRAAAIVGKERYQDLFDDDLPQFGIVAVWITVENRGNREIAVDPKRWYVMAGTRRYPAMSPNEMVDRYYHGRGIRLYVLRADERARDSLGQLSLQRARLAPGASADGFVFFRTDGPAPASWNLEASLVARGIRPGGEQKLDMQLPLYAHS